MAILAFTYDKLHAEKTKPIKGKVSINNNVSVTNVEKTDLSLQDRKALRISFRYKSKYEPKVANIEIEGNIIYTDDDKTVDELLEEWDDNKTLPKDVMREVINYVLSKCNVEAIVLSRDLNIPSPIPLPKVGGDDDSKKGEQKK